MDEKNLAPGGVPLEVLYERPDLPRFALPPVLHAAYGGDVGFDRPRVFSNFVASVDGIVALPEGGESGKIVSLGSAADRLVMGLLRACADAIVVGAGTFRRASKDSWLPEAIYPPAAAEFAELRAKLGLRPRPLLVLVTASGAIDENAPAIPGALVVTGPTGARTLRPRLPESTELFVAGDDSVSLAEVVAHLRSTGSRLVLTEGGPSLMGRFVKERVVDELFLTRSPALFGRFPTDGRKGMVDGVDVSGLPLELLNVRRHGSHLFLRYALK